MSTVLRAIVDEDREKIRAWRNRPDVARWMFTDHVVTEAEHAAWFARVHGDPAARHWIIRHNDDDVGLASLSRIDHHNSRCFWGIYLGDERARGQGIGRAALKLLSDEAFGRLGLHKLCAEVIANNTAALRMYDSLAFEREGILREHVKKGAAWVDVILIAKRRDAWVREYGESAK